MIERSKKNFLRRDKEAQELYDLAEQEGLTYVSETEDTENFTKTLIFTYRDVILELSIRLSSIRYPVMLKGGKAEMLFESLPSNMSKTSEGIRIGQKGKSYPKTKEHVVDQVRLFKLEIDKKVNNSALFS